MKKLFRSLALAGLFAAGATTVVSLGSPALLAQGAKGKTPETSVAKPKDAKTAEVKGTVSIKPDAKDRFRISIKGEDGKTLLMSAGNGFETEKEAREAIDEIKAILKSAKVTVEKGEAKDAGKDK